jgi:cyclic pyranopterin phosphate synthase
MRRIPILYQDALAVAKLWADLGGRREIELGALEPLLWKDGSLTPPDLVRGLVSLGYHVTMTTNASLLQHFAAELKAAGLSLLRISWHTTDPDKYREISGHGDYAQFQAGIHAAARAGLPISFNRVLLRDFTDDLFPQLEFIERYGLRLKLYDLMWTPEISGKYEMFYQDWRPIIRGQVLPRTKKIERAGTGLGRKRMRFHLQGGAFVEIKIEDRIDRSQAPCIDCLHKSKCLEVFGDYFRVEPELQAHFCYLRRDIAFDLRLAIEGGQAGVANLRDGLKTLLGGNFEPFLKSTPLRFITTPFCNYNCFLPGTTISWCHKTTGDYSFPGRPRMTMEPQPEHHVFSTAH